MKTALKTAFLVLIVNLCQAQALQMRFGQPFPFEAGTALSQSTADSSRRYVAKIRYDLVNEKAKSLDLAMKLQIKTLEHTNQTTGYEGLQKSFDSLSEKSENYPKIKRRRFWLGFSVGVVTISFVNYINRKP